MSAFSQIDKVMDFNAAQGDVIDISDLLSGYDPLSDAISDFVQFTDSGSNSILSVDTDGGADNFVQVATLYTSPASTPKPSRITGIWWRCRGSTLKACSCFVDKRHTLSYHIEYGRLGLRF